MIRSVALSLTCLAVVACGDGGDGGDGEIDYGPYQLSFSLDASFQAPHGDQPIRIALVRLTDGVVVGEDIGTVSAVDNPSFVFTTSAVMERGVSYAVRYWIDSNIGGGASGLCDPTLYDHQWSVEFYNVLNNKDLTVGYEPDLMEYVCGTFN